MSFCSPPVIIRWNLNLYWGEPVSIHLKRNLRWFQDYFRFPLARTAVMEWPTLDMFLRQSRSPVRCSWLQCCYFYTLSHVASRNDIISTLGIFLQYCFNPNLPPLPHHNHAHASDVTLTCRYFAVFDISDCWLLGRGSHLLIVKCSQRQYLYWSFNWSPDGW